MRKLKDLIWTFFRMITLLIGVSVLSFVLVTSSPIDPLTAYIGTESTISEEAKAEIAEHWGLNDPPVQRFCTWAKNTAQGDLGTSIAYKKPVINVIGERFKYSLSLMIAAWILSGVLGFLLGMITGIYKGSIFDKVIKVFCIGLQSAPTFWIGLLVISFFSIYLGWFPIGFAAPIGKAAQDITIGDRLYHIVLPALTLSVLSLGKITLYTRQKVIEILGSDFILMAKARGETTFQIIRRHVVRNISLPAITEQFSSFSELFGGMALAETVFSYPGLGSATTAAGVKGDVPLLLGIAIFSAIFVFVGNMTANILYSVLDPRVREEAIHD